jgi:hypothetical protein
MPQWPIGAIDNVSARFDGIEVLSGWAASAADPDGPITVRFYLGSHFVDEVHTGDPRPDVPQVWPSVGGASGWHYAFHEAVLATAHSGNELCAYGIDPGGGQNTRLGCRTLPVSGFSLSNPIGSLDVAAASPGLLRLEGWAGDPDGDRTTQYRVYFDGALMLQRTAARPRPDVELAHPVVGPTTGFNLLLPVQPGPHFVCVYAQNTGPAGLQNSTIGCVTRTIPGPTAPGSHDPQGRIDSIRTTPGGGHLTYSAVGWAYDPDSGGPVDVAFRTFSDPFGISPSNLLQGVKIATGGARPDVQAAIPAAGPNAGFDGTIATTPTARLRYTCAYIVNTGAGTDRFIGCVVPPL